MRRAATHAALGRRLCSGRLCWCSTGRVPGLLYAQKPVPTPPDACERCGAGRFGFDRDMGATKAMAAASEPGCAPGASTDAVQLTALALTEVKLRFYEPFRRFKVWREVRALLPVLGTALREPA